MVKIMRMLKAVFSLFTITILFLSIAYAHRSGCHRWHSCPSDSGSYTCGDTGYCNYCNDNQFCLNGSPRTRASNQDVSNEVAKNTSSENSNLQKSDKSHESVYVKEDVTDLWSLEKRIGIIFPNTKIDIIEEAGDWYKIKLEGFVEKNKVLEQTKISNTEKSKTNLGLIKNKKPQKFKVNIPDNLWKSKQMKWLKINDLKNGYVEIRYMCFDGKNARKLAGYHRGHRKYRITCIDKEGLPTSMEDYDVGGCLSLEGDSIGTDKFPSNLEVACTDIYGGNDKEAVDFNFEWLN